jgi:hypothetical protein
MMTVLPTPAPPNAPTFPPLDFSVLLGQFGRGAMDWITFCEVDRTAVVDRIARDIEEPTEHTFADRHGDGTACVGHAHPALETFSGRHRDGAHPVFAQVLLHFERQLRWVAVDFVLDFERVVDFR